jgi:hypothetical protein
MGSAGRNKHEGFWDVDELRKRLTRRPVVTAMFSDGFSFLL